MTRDRLEGYHARAHGWNMREVIDWRAILALRGGAVAGEADPVPELLDLFRKESRARLEELRSATRDRDRVAVLRLAHAIRGSSGLLGATALNEAAGRLETVMAGAADWTEVEQASDTLAQAIELVLAELDRFQAPATAPDGAGSPGIAVLSAFIRDNPAAIAGIDAAGCLRLCNRAFERLFEYSREEIEGRRIDLFIADEKRLAEAVEFSRRTLDGDAVTVVATRRRRDGTPLNLEITFVPVTEPGTGISAYAAYRQLSDGDRASRRLALQHAVMRCLAESATVQQTASRVLSAIGEHLGWAFGSLWLADESAATLRNVSIWQIDGVRAAGLHAATSGRTFDAGQGLPGQAVAAGRAIWIPDVADAHLLRADDAMAAGFHSALAFPIRSGDRLLGAIEFFSLAIQEPDAELLDTLTTIGLSLGAFLQRKQAEDVLSRFFEMSLDMLCVAGFDGRFKRLNSSWTRVLGHDEHTLLSVPYLDFVHPADVQTTMREAEGLAAGGTTVSFENRYRCADGSYRWLSWSAMADPAEGLIYAVARDNTARREAELQMREALQMKSDFVSFVTHQLRTPLAGIKWMLELAGGAADREEADSFLDDARESAERLIVLVNDLLDVSRLESGKLQIVLEPVQLEEVTAGVLQDVSTLASEKGHAISVSAGPLIRPALVDRQLFRQVLLNLVSNAIKYTPPGGRISIHMDEADGLLRWTIRDNGIGIPEPAQRRLFEKFYRADNALTVDTDGTGLGLYLVRLILDHFHGEVSCESEQGRGSTFMVTLPAMKDIEA